jgi:Uma2 family endonuclease
MDGSSLSIGRRVPPMSSVIAPTFGFGFSPVAPQPRRFSCAEFHQMGDMGWFEGRRAMLIDGEILDMPGPNPPHTTITTKVDTTLRRFFTQGFVIRNQSPLVLGQATDPEPDLAVVAGQLMDFFRAHPTIAALIVEVADSTLSFDTTHKASLYAAAKITDYWVVDLVENRLLVFRQPQLDDAQPFGAKYASITPLKPPATVAPLCQPVSMIQVADLLP